MQEYKVERWGWGGVMGHKYAVNYNREKNEAQLNWSNQAVFKGKGCLR